ncbi:MAG: hypothetical protein AMXMBFR68_04430 [Ignavibacteria bacterium]
MFFLNTTILEIELDTVPTVSENGITETGSTRLSAGSIIRLAPPPHIALIQNARTVPTNRNITFCAIE